MTSSLRPSSFFTDNPVTRAERTYQQRSAKPPRPWRRWLNRTITWLAITIALILFGGLLIASLTLRDPLPLVEKLNPLPSLLGILTFIYHIYLMFQTISRTANSISREKEAQTWDMLVLTGINARQIVRGKWWATVQHQLPSYILLGVLRIGATAGLALGIGTVFYRVSSTYYDQQLMMPHPVTIILCAVVIMAFTLANLGFSAACGVMASAASRRSAIAIARGFGNQILLSLVTAIGLMYLFSRTYSYNISSLYVTILAGAGSLIDNGLTITSGIIQVDNFYAYTVDYVYTPLKPISFDWLFAAAFSMLLYGFLIWFALWQAERRAVAAMATPVSSI